MMSTRVNVHNMVIWGWVHFKEKLNRFKNKDKSKSAVSNKQTNLFDFSMDQITKLSQQFLLQVFLAVLPVSTNIQYWTDRSNTNDGLVSDPVSECVWTCTSWGLPTYVWTDWWSHTCPSSQLPVDSSSGPSFSVACSSSAPPLWASHLV